MEERRPGEPHDPFYGRPFLFQDPQAVRSVDEAERRRRPPDLFDRLRERRGLLVRLALEVAGVVVGIALAVLNPWGSPLLGLALAFLCAVALICDIAIFVRVRRVVDDAWVDLSLPPEDSGIGR